MAWVLVLVWVGGLVLARCGWPSWVRVSVLGLAIDAIRSTGIGALIGGLIPYGE